MKPPILANGESGFKPPPDLQRLYHIIQEGSFILQILMAAVQKLVTRDFWHTDDLTQII